MIVAGLKAIKSRGQAVIEGLRSCRMLAVGRERVGRTLLTDNGELRERRRGTGLDGGEGDAKGTQSSLSLSVFRR
jgi:hypothetical protein